MSVKLPDQEQKQGEDAKYSKILSRKQIQKRLLGLKSEEYEKIIINLQLQNGKLREEVRKLDEKVQQLVQSRRMSKSTNPQVEQELAKMKKQLEVKYESMSYLKQQVQKSGQSNMTEDMKMKIMEQSNTVAQSEMEHKQLQADRDNLIIQIKQNQADLAEFLPNNETDTKMETLKLQSKDLKRRINRLKEQMILQEKNSQSTISKIYDLKKEEKRGLVRYTRSISQSLKDLNQPSTLNSSINDLEKEIEMLKLKKKDVQKDLITDKIIKELKKTKLEKQVRESLQNHKEMYKKRVKMLNQLNLLEKRQEQLKIQLLKQTEIKKIVYKNGQSQTINKLIQGQYRKEWIGKSEGLIFDDSKIIENREGVVIKGVTIYKSTDIIVFAKFNYQSPDKKKYESEPPFDKSILKKCETKKYESKTQAQLKGLTVSVHSPSKKVVRIQLKWLDGEETVIGWEQQGSIKFPFDIMSNERPSCIFGTVSLTGKIYALETLGCEIQMIKL